MKVRDLIILFILFASVPCVKAQTVDESLQLKGMKVEKSGDSISVRFVAEINEKATSKNYKLTLTPVLRKDSQEGKLPPIMVRSKRMRIIDERNGTPVANDAYSAGNGSKVEYRQYLPYDEWMSGSSLYFEGISEGCCDYQTLQPMLVAENLVNPKILPVSPLPVGQGEEARQADSKPVPDDAATAGAKLTAAFPFIASISEYSDGMNKDVALSRDKHIVIHYQVNESNIRSNYMDNDAELARLTVALDQLKQSKQIRLSKVLVVGFSSPDGPTQFNRQLALDRANSLVNYISQSGVSRSLFDIHNGVIAWDKLREYVAGSDMPYRAEVLDIIDHTPVWNNASQVGRLTLLRKLRNGQPYNYMKANFFPLLRAAGVIKLYYEPVPDAGK